MRPALGTAIGQFWIFSEPLDKERFNGAISDDSESDGRFAFHVDRDRLPQVPQPHRFSLARCRRCTRTKRSDFGQNVSEEAAERSYDRDRDSSDST